MTSRTIAQRKEIKSQEHSNTMELKWREQGKQHGFKNGMGTSATSSVKILAWYILGIF